MKMTTKNKQVLISAKGTSPVKGKDIYLRIRRILDAARSKIARTINFEMVQAYWLVGKEIIEEEQKGSKRAEYGTKLIESLSERLRAEYGKGWSPSHLWHVRQFYLTFQERCPKIPHTLCAESDSHFLHALRAELTWSHYRILMRFDDPKARSFYEIECAKNNWSIREMERQIGSLLFERLALSKDKKGLLRLATKGHEIQTYRDLIKDPYVLEFSGLPQSEKLYESDLEQALIDNLSKFLMELGRGFAFVARQKRITVGGEHYFIDLVFYNTIGKFFMCIELKITRLTHQDLGQMQMYVNYYDRELKSKDDGPTVGVVLCADKDEAVVRYTLPETNKQIFAARYKLYLPTEEELKREFQRERRLLEHPKQQPLHKEVTRVESSRNKSKR